MSEAEPCGGDVVDATVQGNVDAEGQEPHGVLGNVVVEVVAAAP